MEKLVIKRYKPQDIDSLVAGLYPCLPSDQGWNLTPLISGYILNFKFEYDPNSLNEIYPNLLKFQSFRYPPKKKPK